MAVFRSVAQWLVLVSTLSLATVGDAWGQTQGTAPLPPGAKATLDEIDKALSEDSTAKRNMCAAGSAPGWVAEKRARYGARVPFADAPDLCVATLEGLASSRSLFGFYRELLISLGGDAGTYSTFPQRIAASVLKDTQKVPIGNGKVATITPALAFDAGFTVGYQDKATDKSTTDPAKLKAGADKCLRQQSDDGTCFSIGYVYGGHAAAAAVAGAH
jgi:hypothetical protein